MKNKITLQSIYNVFLCIHAFLLIIAGFTVKEEKYYLREEKSCVEIVPDSHEISGDGIQRYTFRDLPGDRDY